MIDEPPLERKTAAEELGFGETTRKLLELKDISELMVDLSYSALLYDNEDIAHEIISLEEIADELEKEVVISALADIAKHGDEKTAFVIIRLAQSIEKIADAAVSIADVVLRDIDSNPVICLSLRDSKTIITSVTVTAGSSLDGRSLGEIKLASESGMWVIAIRRGKRFIYGPDENTAINGGDVLIARGPREGETLLRKMARG